MASKAEVATHLDLSERQIGNLLKDHILPAAKGPAGLLLDDCRVAYIRHLRRRTIGRPPGNLAQQASAQSRPAPADDANAIPNIEAQREREEYLLIKERRITQQQKNEVAAQKLVPTEFAIFTLSKIAAEIATVLDTLPMTMKRKHPDLETRHIDTLLRELARARNIASSLDESVPELLDEFFENINQAD